VKLHRRLALPLFAVAIAVSVIGTAGVVLLVRHTFRIALAAQARQLASTTASVLNARGRELQNIATVLAILDGPVAKRVSAWKHAPLDTVLVLDRSSGRVRSRTGVEPDPADLAAVVAAAPLAPALLEDARGLLLSAAEPDKNRKDLVVLAAVRLDDAFASSLRELLQGDVEILVHDRRTAGTATAKQEPNETRALDVPLRTAGGRGVTIRVHVPAAEIVRAERRAVALSVSGGTVLLAVALLLYGLTVERALRQTQERLVHSAKLSTVGQLVAGVSHELNNPLLGLIGSAEQLADRVKEEDPGRAHLDLILKEAHRLKRTLADLRGFVRPSGADRVALDLNLVVKDVVGLVRHQAAQAQVECEVDFLPERLAVNASPDQLRQVFLNLAVNALEAMPGGGRLRVAVARNGGPVAVVTVADTGPGLVGQARDRATEPFFSTKPGRLGLGLAISRDIVESHGGRLSLAAAPDGTGTVATVEFPAAPA
jgi:signal transduction histidine kinase